MRAGTFTIIAPELKKVPGSMEIWWIKEWNQQLFCISQKKTNRRKKMGLCMCSWIGMCTFVYKEMHVGIIIFVYMWGSYIILICLCDKVTTRHIFSFLFSSLLLSVVYLCLCLMLCVSIIRICFYASIIQRRDKGVFFLNILGNVSLSHILAVITVYLGYPSFSWHLHYFF